MKADTTSGSSYTFSILDIPVYLSNTEFILIKKDNSPILLGNTIRIGDEESGLYVNDIVKKNGVEYLISYERGFYGISRDYVRCYLSDLSDCKYVGTYDTMDFDIPVQKKKRIRFKYKTTIFTLHDIIGCFENKLLLRLDKTPVDPKLCQQEVGIYYKGKRLYLGDKTDQGTIIMQDGRIYAQSKNGLKAINRKEL